MLEGFRFFAPRGELGEFNPEELQRRTSYSGQEKRAEDVSKYDSGFVYFNANTVNLDREKAAQQHDSQIEGLLLETANLNTKGRAQEHLEREADRQLALMLWQRGREFGFRLFDPLAALRNHSDLLLESKTDHQCSSETCHFFNLRRGVLFPDLYTRSILSVLGREKRPSRMVELEGLHFETMESSGLIYICKLTGAVHICNGECDAISVDITDECRGRFCVISGIFKGNLYDEMPSGRNVSISRQRIDSINAGHKRMMEVMAYRSYARAFDADRMDGDEEDDNPGEVEYANVPIEVVHEEKQIDEREKRAAEEENAPAAETDEVVETKQSTLINQDLVNEEEDGSREVNEEDKEFVEESSSDEENDGKKKKRKKRGPYNLDDLMVGAPAVTATAEMPRGSGEVVPKTIGNAFEMPSDPDARTEHFLKNPEQRQIDLMKLLGSLLDYQSHSEVWDIQLQQEGKRAQDQLLSYRRKHKYHQMTVSAQYVFLAAHVATYTAPMPVPRTPLLLPPYAALINKAWDMIVHSPYVRDYNKPRLIPNMTSTTLGLLYRMAQGPVIWDCSLSTLDLPVIPAGLEQLNLRNFKIEVIPHGGRLGVYLLPLEQLIYLNLKKKKKTQGFRCFNDCMVSTVDRLRQELFAGLKVDPYQAVLRYTSACVKLKCG